MRDPVLYALGSSGVIPVAPKSCSFKGRCSEWLIGSLACSALALIPASPRVWYFRSCSGA